MKNTSKISVFLSVAPVLFLVALFYPTDRVHAAQDLDQDARKAMVERANDFCEAVVPAWLSSDSGVNDPNIKGLITDCYTSNLRLALIGLKNRLPLEEVALEEVPATLLRAQTGISLDVYKPLIGRKFKTLKGVR